MKIKARDRFKTTEIETGEWWIEEVVEIKEKQFLIKMIKASYKIKPGAQREERLDWFDPLKGYLIQKINHHNTKLGKILYK